MNTIFEIMTSSNSIYKLSCSKNKKVFILTSDSSAFKNIDFILLKSVSIRDRLNFIGTVYYDAIIDSKGNISKKQEDKEINKVEMKNEESTTSIENIKIVNEKMFKKLKRKKILIT